MSLVFQPCLYLGTARVKALFMLLLVNGDWNMLSTFTESERGLYRLFISLSWLDYAIIYDYAVFKLKTDLYGQFSLIGVYQSIRYGNLLVGAKLKFKFFGYTVVCCVEFHGNYFYYRNSGMWLPNIIVVSHSPII